MWYSDGMRKEHMHYKPTKNKHYTIVVEALVQVDAPDEEIARDMAYEYVNDAGFRVDGTHVALVMTASSPEGN